jgi:hypothetical protein
MEQLQRRNKQNILVYSIVALLIGSAIIYLQMGIRDAIRMTSHSQTTTFRHGEEVGGGGGRRVDESNNVQARVFRIPGGQMIFYIITGLAHLPLVVWMLKDKLHRNKVPYIIAIIGSLALIVLYILSRTVSLPLIGFEEHIGSIDLLSKVLQVGIIIGSAIMLKIQYKQQKQKLIRLR